MPRPINPIFWREALAPTQLRVYHAALRLAQRRKSLLCPPLRHLQDELGMSSAFYIARCLRKFARLGLLRSVSIDRDADRGATRYVFEPVTIYLGQPPEEA